MGTQRNQITTALLLLSTAGVLASCGPKISDKAAIEAAIGRAQSGELIQAIDAAHAQAIKPVQGASLQQARAMLPQVMEADPCADVPKPEAGSPDAVMADAMTKFGACLGQIAGPAFLTIDAIDYFKTYTQTGDRAESELNDAELIQLLSSSYKIPEQLFGTGSPQLAQLRDRYTNAELDELQKLVARRDAAFLQAEARIFKAMDVRPALLQRFKGLDRYAVLLALRENANDLDGQATGAKLLAILTGHMGVPRQLANFPCEVLHPYALMAVVPGKGDELKGLDPNKEDPFLIVRDLMSELGGNPARVQEIVKAYSDVRDQDNPPMPSHPAAAADAAKVAYIDTGIDFIQFPDLALFAGNGQNGQLAQADVGDRDDNPWQAGVGLLDHGTGTMATLLTIVGQKAPELLRDRKIELAMWKASSARSMLAGPPFTQLNRWDKRGVVSFQDAIFGAMARAGAKPKIVSLSAAFPTEPFLQQAGKPTLISETPWLWVMAAGNDGQDVHQGKQACFDDVPADRRPDARILCIGALVKREGGDKIAVYSNFGDRVDVYAYESYDGRCPNGTSCSTPAITSAAAILAAKYPSLSPEQLKLAIVQAGVERTLEVDMSPAQALNLQNRHLPKPTKKIKVFDPLTQLDQALANAAALVRAQSTRR